MSFGNAAGAVATCDCPGLVAAFRVLDAPSAAATALFAPPCNAATSGLRSWLTIGSMRLPSSLPSEPVSCRLACIDPVPVPAAAEYAEAPDVRVGATAVAVPPVEATSATRR